MTKTRAVQGPRRDSDPLLRLRQTREGEGAEAETEVAEHEVQISARDHEVSHDSDEPDGDQVPAEPRTPRDDQACDDLDHTDHHHECVRCDAERMAHGGSEVLVPVGEQVEELVEPGDDRRDREPETEDGERLMSFPVHVGCSFLFRGARAPAGAP